MRSFFSGGGVVWVEVVAIFISRSI
jgi:hypothetical protein